MSDAAAVAVVPADKRPQVETLLGDVLKLMDYPAKLDFKDMPDGSLGVAVHFEGAFPGITPGKRSYLVDCVQFWLNKVVNRPNVPRRWVNLGVNAFPELRQPAHGREQAAVAPLEKRVEAPKRPAAPVAKPSAPPPARRPRETVDERTLSPVADPAMTAAGKLLAEKAAKHGRYYGVMLLSPDARALMLKAADGVKGVTAKVEGEGHWRRLVMVPDKPTPIPKKQVMPDYDDGEEDE